MTLPLLAAASILVGAGMTGGMGEEPRPAPQVSLRLAAESLAFEADWIGAAKLESGAGNILRAAVDVRYSRAFAGLAYSRRDGGAWVKHVPWARAGVDYGALAVFVRAAIDSPNRELGAEVRGRGRIGRLLCEARVFVTSHVQGTGFGSALLVGVGSQ